MASIHLGQVRDMRLMARPLDARRGGCFRRLRRRRAWRSSITFILRKTVPISLGACARSVLSASGSTKKRRALQRSFPCHIFRQAAPAERARRRTCITSFATDRTAATVTPTTDCRKPYFAVCTCQLRRCFRIVDRSLQQLPYFLFASLKSDCPRPPIPQVWKA